MPTLTKYPRTLHLPWSPGQMNDDRMASEAEIRENFGGQEVVVTEKLDGENTTIYSDGTSHARSLSSSSRLDRDYVRGLAQRIGCLGLPVDLRIFGENLFAKHSIGYDRLPNFFVIFGAAVRDQALSWDEVMEWAKLLDLPTAPILYRGKWAEKEIRSLYPFHSRFNYGSEAEGYVVRLASGFAMEDFETSVAKFVRKDHVTTDKRWSHSRIVPNRTV